MMILFKMPLTAQDMGALACVFFLAAGLLRLVSYMIKERKSQPCQAFKDKNCGNYDTLQDLVKKVDAIHSALLGHAALGNDGIPRWYIRDDHYAVVENLQKSLNDIQARLNNQ